MSNFINQIQIKPYLPQIKPTMAQEKKRVIPYAISVPLLTGLGGYYGYDSFKKEKIQLEKALDTKVDGNIQNFRNKVLSNLADLILRIKEGRPTDMPNCLMIKGTDPKYCERFIDWIGETSNGAFIKMTAGEGIVTQLEKAEERFQKTKKWNVLYVKGMDKLIDHNQVAEDMVEYMKDIMCATSEDYHTTIVFSTSEPEKLDKIALQPHRVKKTFNLDEIDEIKFFRTDEIIQNWEKNNKKYEQLINNKNIKIIKFATGGLILGTTLAAGINWIINKKKK